MGTDGACSLLFCAAKRNGAYPPNMPVGLRARVSRLGGFTRPFSPVNCAPPTGVSAHCNHGRGGYQPFPLAPNHDWVVVCAA
jgi:hypothetical protein